MQVQYRETKTGFDCVHMPSIDLSSLPTGHRQLRHHKQGSSGSNEISNTISARRAIVKKASKLSMKMKNRDGNKADVPGDKEKELPSRPSGGTSLTATQSSGSSSFFNVSSNTHTVVADAHRSESDPPTSATVEASSRPHSPSTVKTLPPIPRDFASNQQTQIPQSLQVGAVEEELFESISANKLAVRFEINVVKVRCARLCLEFDIGTYLWFVGQVPWLPLHGIQFRRASGDGWQYHMLARRVLTELKL
jgi:serine/threonine protein kinase KIN1/2